MFFHSRKANYPETKGIYKELYSKSVYERRHAIRQLKKDVKNNRSDARDFRLVLMLLFITPEDQWKTYLSCQEPVKTHLKQY